MVVPVVPRLNYVETIFQLRRVVRVVGGASDCDGQTVLMDKNVSTSSPIGRSVVLELTLYKE